MKETYTKIFAIFTILIIIVFISACAPESELKPPDTSIEQMQSVYGQTGIRMVLSGADDKTPVEKLTYRYTFYIKSEDDEDNEELFMEGDCETSELFVDSLEFKEGEYIAKVSAVNEFGLEDKTPAEGTFKVDLTPPEMPVIRYQIISGEVDLKFVNNETGDIAGYEMILSNSVDTKAFSSTLDRFTFKANKGDHYEIAVKAYDNAGNNSEEAKLLIDTSVDEAPYLENELPNFLGNSDSHIPVSFYDDWANPDEITVQATFNGKAVQINEEGLDIDVSILKVRIHSIFI